MDPPHNPYSNQGYAQGGYPQQHGPGSPFMAQHQGSPYMDEPLLPPNRGGYAMEPRPGSAQGGAGPAMGGGGYRDSAWSSQVSLAPTNEDRGLLGGAPATGRYNAHPQYPSDDFAGSYNSPTPAWSKEAVPAPRSNRKRWLIIGAIVVLIIAAAAAAVVYFAVIRPKNRSTTGTPSSGSSGSSGSNSTSSPGTKVLISGGDGSMVTTEDGSQFMYNNSFGGYWQYDPKTPYTGGGKANSWTPAVNESWNFGVNKINGVNLGGWLVMEPFITPSYYQQYYNQSNPVVDEWTLSTAMRADTANGGIAQLEQHYKTFITEQDFAEIAGAGLTWVRIPIPFWAVYKYDAEPFLEGASWQYFLKAIGWARKYGIRINVDLHTIPGSQNGWNHSGKLYVNGATFNFLQGVMGYANAQRALDYIRVIAEFISQPQYSDVIQIFGIMNEPNIGSGNPIALAEIKRFYYQVYTMVRSITGLGAGKGPMISFFHGFAPTISDWSDWLPEADRIALDHHPYIIFGGQVTNDPPASYASGPCSSWGAYFNQTQSTFGFIGAGEFSAAINDCGLWITGVDIPINYEKKFGVGSCDQWIQWQNWTPDIKAGMQTFVSAQMDTLQNWFFWTWKIGPAQDGIVKSPFWSYKLGLENGWMPKNPQAVSGTCNSIGVPQNQPFNVANYKPWQTGGPGGSLTPSTTEDYSWPPPTITGAGAPVSQLPFYTPTGGVTPLPGPTPTDGAGSGWNDAGDTRGIFVPIAGCSYPDPWNAGGIAVPPLCTGA